MLQDGERTALYTALSHQDSSIAFNAAVTLAGQGDTAALPVLLEAMGHENRVFRRNHVIKALSSIGQTGVPIFQKALSDNDTGRARALVGIAYALYQIDQNQLPLIQPILLRLLRDDDSQARSDTIWVLNNIGPAAREAVPDLLERASDRNESVRLRCAALETAWQLEDISERAHLLIVDFLHDKNEDTRRSAVQILAQRGPEAAANVPALIERLEDEEETFPLRIQSAYALAAIGRSHPDALAAFTRLLQQKDWWLRVFAARGLAHMTHAAVLAIPALIEALHDPEWNVVRNALYALAQMGEQATPAIESITPLLDDARLSGLAAETLAKIGSGAIPALDEMLQLEEKRPIAAYALLKSDASAASTTLAGVEGSEFRPSFNDFLFSEPEMVLSPAKIRAFEELYNSAVANGAGEIISYTLSYPKYEFLQYICRHKDIMVHGSNQIDIEILNPLRQSTDMTEHGSHHGIYADPIGIRPMYFALVDRTRVGTLVNGFIDPSPDNNVSQRLYLFAIDAVSLRERPWREGMLYLLPRAVFEDVGEWICREAQRPLARLSVAPDDFPFLDQIMGCDFSLGLPGWVGSGPTMHEWYKLALQGYPFLDDVQVFAVRW